VLAGRADEALLDTYQVERDPHVRAVIGAAVAAGRYICLLDPQAAAERDLDLRAKMKDAAPATAADLIPPIQAGVVMPESGERFIQPYVRDSDGERVLLDDISGRGFRLLVTDPGLIEGLSSTQRAWLGDLEVTIVPVAPRGEPITDGLSDVDGDLTAWFAQRQAKAALIRPDFYVFGTAATEAQLQALVDRLVQAASPSQPVSARQEEAVPCRV
jgi:3-(3-hydroxy-phenyl)propionate hydroxylase